MAKSQNPFEIEQVALRHFAIDKMTGELVCVPISMVQDRKPGEVDYRFVDALDAFLRQLGLEARDVMRTHKSRPNPLEDLLEVRCNLMPIDTSTLLDSAHINDAEEKLRQMTFADCTTQARATVETVKHNGLYVNTAVTLAPCADNPPFDPVYAGHRMGNYHEPAEVEQTGTFQFALSDPFCTDYQLWWEADQGAWHMGAVLMEVIDNRS